MTESLPNIAGVDVPSSPLISPLLAYLRQHTSPSTVNHSIRAAYFSLILCKRFPPAASAPPGAINFELIVLANLAHDLGWATTRELLSNDKRFEVDGANLAVKFVQDNKNLVQWSQHDLQLLWTIIAIHATPSFAQHHPAPEVALVHLGILADFFGPFMPEPLPPGLIQEEEYLEIIKHFPREGFRDEIVQVFCGLCREKAETTFDNWQREFGIKYGLDASGKEDEAFKQRVEEAAFLPMLMGALGKSATIEPEDKLSKPREQREKYWYEAK